MFSAVIQFILSVRSLLLVCRPVVACFVNKRRRKEREGIIIRRREKEREREREREKKREERE